MSGTKIPATKELTPAQKTARTKARQKAERDALVKADEVRLAQIVNLMLAGLTPAQIGLEIGASADEVEQMIMRDAQRFIRTQPALRTYVRKWISGKFTELLDAIWDDATEKTSNSKITANGFDRKLASQDRAIKILDRLAKLHGADAPTQTEIKVEAAPEAVDKLVAALAASQGQGYDVSIFDVVDGEVVHEAAQQAGLALEVSGNSADFQEDSDED